MRISLVARGCAAWLVSGVVGPAFGEPAAVPTGGPAIGCVQTTTGLDCRHTSTPQTPAAPPLVVAAPTHVKVPEGTEVRLRLAERMTSSTVHTGDTFSVILDEDMQLPDGTVIPAGYAGRGEITDAEHNGALGRSGKISLRINYLRVGDTRIRLRASQASEGSSGVTNTVVMTVLFGIPGLLVHGHSAVYQKGAPLLAFVDQDVDLPLPLPKPPISD